MPTPAPCRPTAAMVASTSCSRRARRCSSHRESRRSRLDVSAFTAPRVPDTLGNRQSPGRRRAVPPPSKNPEGPMAPQIRKAAVVGGNRIPFARSNSAYAQASGQDMLTAPLDGLVARFGLQGQQLGEVVAGAVLKHSRDVNLTREAVLGSRLSAATPAYDVQLACGTGLEAAVLVANKIALGQIESGIAGGVDTTSDAPLAVNEDLRRTLIQLNSARTLGERLKPAAKLRPLQPFKPEIPRNAEPRTGLSMGDHAAKTALRWNVDRQAQDELAIRSHQRLAAAYDKGFFDDLMTPYLGL